MSCEDEHYHSHSHSHSHNHNHDDNDHIAPIPTSSSQSLNSKIDTYKVTALNMANPTDDLPKLFKDTTTKYQIKPVIRSDCDEQLIINIPFLNGSVKLYSVILRTNGGSYCPRTIKLFKNDKTIDFDNVDQKKPVQTITHPHVGVADYDDEDDDLPEVLQSDDDFVEHFVSRHKFTGVQQLTIFIENIYDDEGEEECRVHSIELRGEFTELNKDPVITLYESAANPADHKNITVVDHQHVTQ
ncbi:hypothetical protein SBY92_001684 [Candida maltosa Xu316]|uniref:PITH domain-containing protein n=1 Tax=Candida maltosa (strain Xu316) TaxID=1245528 RepID=M3JF89_CANMX|nr:hypothetical protein G210_5944 [Candida maltosa Xu316]